MGVIYTNRDNQGAEYDFAKSGGAIGTYRLGLYIDSFSYIDTFFVSIKTAFASGGAATISFGYRTAAGASFPTALIGATAFAGPFVFPNAVENSLPIEITMSIAVAPVTAGRIKVLAEYFNTDF